MEELINDIQDLIDNRSGQEVVDALVTVLKLALKQCAPSEEDRLDVIDDIAKFLKENKDATQ